MRYRKMNRFVEFILSVCEGLTTRKFFLFLFVGSFVVTNFSLPGLAPASPSGRQEKYEFVLQWGSQGSGDGQFGCPDGIAVDSTGNVYVVDYSIHRIQKFSRK